MRLLSISLLIAAASVASAEDVPNLRANAGVGIGTEIFASVGSEGLLSQVCAVTTNGTFGNQTFAITTGTLGARKWDSIVANPQINTYVRENFDMLARDMASGSGEALEGLAELLALPANDLGTKVQGSFNAIFTSKDVTHEQVLANLDRVLSAS